LPGMVESIRCLKQASISLVSPEDSALLCPYFDFMIQGMQTSC
jgi:allophycocyanin-B